MAFGSSFIVGLGDAWGMVGGLEGLAGKARRVRCDIVVNGGDVCVA